MIRISVNRPKNLPSVGFTRSDMAKVGHKAIDTIEKRCSRGLNVYDQPAKPLSNNYADKKRKAGESPTRNLTGSGSMFRSLDVLNANQDQVTVGFTSSKERIKAAANNKRDPFFGVSPNDERVVTDYADQLFNKRSKEQ